MSDPTTILSTQDHLQDPPRALAYGDVDCTCGRVAIGVCTWDTHRVRFRAFDRLPPNPYLTPDNWMCVDCVADVVQRVGSGEEWNAAIRAARAVRAEQLAAQARKNMHLVPPLESTNGETP